MLEVIIYIANAVGFAILFIFTRQLTLALKTLTPPTFTSKIGEETDLPSVTVCIPARNEQHALTDCLQRVLASTYERLEIIVLDDVSGDDTSALIKSFAHEGVRFVKGAALPHGWLGKNHALQGLLDEASGTYILYVDVDTVLAPQAIENMVRYALSTRASMVSVLPRREDGWRASVIASPLRYFWELVFHRSMSPGTASSAWLIRRDTLLQTFKGFGDIKAAVQPESKLAASLATTGDYRFLVSTEAFGISYEKKWRSQLLTSTRLLYPLLGKRFILALAACLDLLIFIIPFIVILAVLFGAPISPAILGINVLLGLGFMVLYGIYARRVWKEGWLIGAIVWPLLVIQELILVIASTLQYSRRTVKWKGRLIRPEVQS